MSRVRVSCGLFLCAGVVAGAAAPKAPADEVSVFLMDRDARVALRLPDFVPSRPGMPNTILAGRFGGDVNLTVIMQKDRGGGPRAVRARYYPMPAKPQAEARSFRHFETNKVPFAAYRFASPQANFLHLHAFFAGEGCEFDVHLSCMSPPDQEAANFARMEAAALTFSIRKEAPLSAVQNRILAVHRTLRDDDSAKALKAIEDILHSHASEPYGHYVKGQILLFWQKNFTRGAAAFERAVALWEKAGIPLRFRTIYANSLDGLGLALAQAGKMAEARPVFEKGYAFSTQAKAIDLIRQSAYHLACWHAESGHRPEALRYLEKAIDADARVKEQARNDTSFRALREDAAFKALVEGRDAKRTIPPVPE